MKGPRTRKTPSANVKPISSEPINPPCPDAALSFVNTPDGIVISSTPSSTKHEKDQRNKTVDPRVRSELNCCRRTQRQRQDQAKSAEQNDDAETER